MSKQKKNAGGAVHSHLHQRTEQLKLDLHKLTENKQKKIEKNI